MLVSVMLWIDTLLKWWWVIQGGKVAPYLKGGYWLDRDVGCGEGQTQGQKEVSPTPLGDGTRCDQPDSSIHKAHWTVNLYVSYAGCCESTSIWVVGALITWNGASVATCVYKPGFFWPKFFRLTKALSLQSIELFLSIPEFFGLSYWVFS